MRAREGLARVRASFPGFLAGLVASLALTGCAATKMYGGPARPLDEVALLEGGGRAGCRILGPAPAHAPATRSCAPLVRAIDGAPVGLVHTDSYALAPGRHVIDAAFGLGRGWRTIKPDGARRLALSAAAGKRYRLLAERRYREGGEAATYLWVEDEASGEVVAGERPPGEPAEDAPAEPVAEPEAEPWTEPGTEPWKEPGT